MAKYTKSTGGHWAKTAGENIYADKVFQFNGIVLEDICRVVQGQETLGEGGDLSTIKTMSLQKVQTNNILHGDINPVNILKIDQNMVKLADLGEMKDKIKKPKSMVVAEGFQVPFFLLLPTFDSHPA
ncbi:hypothetical protein K457DRAFT_120690 [Linnemannia elongata AG-77]|uniref:Protein kinase domain-containing protein n=1 Tax=Linnemannia elongata AG-77 TaxID=1314771 RepID=A0A197KHX8_9FUNG|nr:hypothetical protein K457DRAFT_120690 [Linnemannia elongata AG-77]